MGSLVTDHLAPSFRPLNQFAVGHCCFLPRDSRTCWPRPERVSFGGSIPHVVHRGSGRRPGCRLAPPEQDVHRKKSVDTGPLLPPFPLHNKPLWPCPGDTCASLLSAYPCFAARKTFNTLAYIFCAGFLIAAGFTHQGQVGAASMYFQRFALHQRHVCMAPSCLTAKRAIFAVWRVAVDSPATPPTQNAEAVAFLSLSQGLSGLAMAGMWPSLFPRVARDGRSRY